MSFNFPNSPIQGQLYTPVGGYQYVYLDGVWRVVEAPQNVGTAQTRSRIVNGAMQVSQENGNTASSASGYYAADQWMAAVVGTGTFTTQRVQVTTPNGSVNRFRATATVADAAMAAGDFYGFSQTLEGIRVADFRWGTASARQVVLRFGWKSPAGTYCFSLNNGGASYLGNIVVSAGQANTDTTQTFVIPGATISTWATGTGSALSIWFVIAAGSGSFGTTGWSAADVYATSGSTNGMATAGNVFELWDVGLYLDPLATGIAPPWVMPDEAEELRACRRYYYSNCPPARGLTTGGTAVNRMGCHHPEPMRIIPAITMSGTLGLFDGTAVPGLASISASYCTAEVLEFEGLASAATLTASRPLVLYQSSGRISVNARM